MGPNLLILVLLVYWSSLFATAADTEQATVEIYLASHGWHAGIVLERTENLEANWQWPSLEVFKNQAFLEIGWGDYDFYQTPDPHPGLVLKAALVPTQSVLHVAGFNGPVSDYFPRSEIIKLVMPYSGYQKLVQSIIKSFAKDSAGHAISLGHGLYGESRFYQSVESYHLFNTCNVWTARQLKAGGLPFTPSAAITVDDLMSQARTIGTKIQEASDAVQKLNLEVLDW